MVTDPTTENYYENKKCKINTVSHDDHYQIEKNDGYGIHSIKIEETRGRLFLSLSNPYHLPFSVFIYCKDLTPENTVQELKAALDYMIEIE